MQIGSKQSGISFSIDLGDFQRSLKAREQVKMEGLAKAEANTAKGLGVDENFNPRTLVNDLQEKGRLLDIVA